MGVVPRTNQAEAGAPPDPHRLPLAELVRLGAARPRTLFEAHALAAWARRAVAGETPLPPVVAAVVAACTEDGLLFGSPPGTLAALVLDDALPPIREALWARAREHLDGLSYRRLASALGRPADAGPAAPRAEPDTLVLWIYGTTTTEAVQAALAPLGLPSEVDASLSAPDAGELGLVTARTLSREELSGAVGAVARTIGVPVSCTLASAEGDLGPDRVLHAGPDGVVRLARVDLDGHPPPVVELL